MLNEVVKDYDFDQEISAPLEELVGIEEQVPTEGIITLEEMKHVVEEFRTNLPISLSQHPRHARYLYDKELRLIDDLLDNRILNELLSYDGYTPSMRKFLPSTLFRAELLKAIKYPEISYRKFCDVEYMGRERKQNRVFLGLGLHTADIIDHTRLSQFTEL